MSDRPPHHHLLRPIAILAAAALALSACSSPDSSPDSDRDSSSNSPSEASTASAEETVADDALAATTADMTETNVLVGDTAAALSVQASQAFFASAPVVVITTEQDALQGASAAVALGVPVLLDDEQLPAELDRLGAEVALAVGVINDPGIDVVVPQDAAGLADLVGASAAASPVAGGEHVASLIAVDPSNAQLLSADAVASASPSTSASAAPSQSPSAPEPLSSDRDELPAVDRPEALEGVTVMTTGADRDVVAVGSALAAGATVVVVAGGDPRASTDSVSALAANPPEFAVGIGPEFGDAETLTWRLASAATGTELPGGGQLVLPGKTYIALYGTPGAPVLGVLGEQEGQATIDRAAGLAKEYEPLVDQPVIPALEIITTVASAEAGADGDYSNELSAETLRPLIDLAAENGQYVVLDLQPGRTDFLTQAKLYEDLLLLPHVGLALDPEWRLLPNERHLRQIGHVEVAEVNSVITWLADLTRANNLPQKVLVLHQFQVQSLRDVALVDQSRSELAVLIHVDGLGAQSAKQNTWKTLLRNSPDIKYWGWKNFYDEDIPGPLTPAQTIADVDPVPDFVSYQ